MLFISAVLGAEALAYYAIGSFAVRITDVLRGAIADAIFPEILSVKHATPRDALRLWQRATVWYCILLFPIAILLAYYSDEAVTILFTEEYKPAAPVFATFTLLMYLICFDFHLPLRVRSANRFFLLGSSVKLVINLSLLYPAYLVFGLTGPIVALLISQLLFISYLGNKATTLYEISWSEVLPWRDVAKVLFAALICMPILASGRYLVSQPLIQSISFGALYLIVYVIVLRSLRLSEVKEMIGRVFFSVTQLIQSAKRIS
jgi:O-antigen/teichoic acid export membrane protein